MRAGILLTGAERRHCLNVLQKIQAQIWSKDAMTCLHLYLQIQSGPK